MYFMIDPKMISEIYDNKDFDIDLLQFKMENAAQHYLLKHGYSVNIKDEIIEKEDIVNDLIKIHMFPTYIHHNYIDI